jgi:hypothetical protein
MDHGTAVRVEVEGLPALLVSGEVYAPEPEVGIFWEQVYDLDWCAAEGELTPEMQFACAEREGDIERAYVATLAERRRAAMEGDAAEEIYLRAAGGW